MKNFFAMTLLSLVLMCARADAAELSAADSAFAFETIVRTLHETNCTPLKIWYSGTPLDDAQNVAYMNQLADSRGFDHNFTACMVFHSDFRSPPDPHDGKVTAWNYDTVYTDYTWYFGLYDGQWILMTRGY